MTRYQRILVPQDTFHGKVTVPIRGRNLRIWNEYAVAIDMTSRHIATMERVAACPVRTCTCGGAYIAMPLPGESNPRPPVGGVAVRIFPAVWLPEKLQRQLGYVDGLLEWS